MCCSISGWAAYPLTEFLLTGVLKQKSIKKAFAFSTVEMSSKTPPWYPFPSQTNIENVRNIQKEELRALEKIGVSDLICLEHVWGKTGLLVNKDRETGSHGFS